jgi:hypothetical protein
MVLEDLLLKFIRFRKFINEAKNTSQLSQMKHLEHVDDFIFNEGIVGVNQAIKFLEYMHDVMKGHSKSKVITQSKWDGSPSLVAGINPENKKFFVATKSAFSQNPKLAYTDSDIQEMYGHSADLADKMSIALKYLPSVIKNTIIQGDLLFTDSNKKKETIDGDDYITFRANTLTFAVPTNSDLADTINRAKIGIVFHCTYDGNTIQEMKINWGITKTMFVQSPDVWWQTSTIEDLSGKVFFTESETKQYDAIVSNIKQSSKKLDSKLIDFIVDNQILIKSYNNKKIAADESFTNIDAIVKGLPEYIKEKYQKEIDKVKTDKSKQQKTDAMNVIVKMLIDSEGQLKLIYSIFNLFVDAKNMLISKLEELRDTKFFVETPDGYKVTKSEGFVIADKFSNYVIKLVDRTEFSRMNANMSLNRK